MEYKVTTIDQWSFKWKKIRTVTLGRNVRKIKRYAFQYSNAEKLIIRTRNLTKGSVKGCLEKSKIKSVKIDVGDRNTNKKYVKKYKKIFTSKNVGRKVTVK